MQVYRVTVDDNGTVSWYNERDELHREGGLPAVECDDGYKAYFEHGRRHRLDGPAILYYSGRTEYWIAGKRLTKEEFENFTKKKIQVYKVTVDDNGITRWYNEEGKRHRIDGIPSP